jgi:hypothetical protein
LESILGSLSVDKNVDRAVDTNEDEIYPELDPRLQALINRHSAANNARIVANKELVQKAIRTALVRDQQMLKKDKTTILVGSYVMAREEAHRKFGSNWFGPYKVI